MIKQTIFTALIAFSISAMAETLTPTNAPTQPATISVQEMLKTGPSQLKMHSLAMITQGNIRNPVDESYLPGLSVCAKDKDSLLRSMTARILGQYFVADKEIPHPEALQLLQGLATDDSGDVRFNAVYYGLTQTKHKTPKIAEQLIDIAAQERNPALHDRIIISLANYQPQVTEILDAKLAKGDDIAIYEIYEEFTGNQPLNADQFLDLPSSRPHLIIIKPSGKDAETTKAALIAELEKEGLKNPAVQISGKGDNYVLMLTTYITRDYQTAKGVLSNHGQFSITQNMWLTPELEIQIEAMRKAQ